MCVHNWLMSGVVESCVNVYLCAGVFSVFWVWYLQKVV